MYIASPVKKHPRFEAPWFCRLLSIRGPLSETRRSSENWAAQKREENSKPPFVAPVVCTEGQRGFVWDVSATGDLFWVATRAGFPLHLRRHRLTMSSKTQLRPLQLNKTFFIYPVAIVEGTSHVLRLPFHGFPVNWVYIPPGISLK